MEASILKHNLSNLNTMKTKINVPLTAVLLLSALGLPLSAFGQGSLTPPGAPAMTMKSLDQIEARTIVNAVNTPGDANNLFIISQPGSYYLTTNLVGVTAKNGVEITASNVTLDLNGFAVLGVVGSKAGIYVANVSSSVAVRNGSVSGWGNYGVLGGSYGVAFQNLLFERLLVSGNTNGGILSANCTIQNCQSSGNAGSGIEVMPGIVSGCLVQNNTSYGIEVNASGSQILGNTCIGNNPGGTSAGSGIFVFANNTRVDGNYLTGNGYAGIVCQYFNYSNNIIIRNIAVGNSPNNYLGSSSQIIGPYINTTASSTVTNSNPWANFSF
jgi:hypothetical protein